MRPFLHEKVLELLDAAPSMTALRFQGSGAVLLRVQEIAPVSHPFLFPYDKG